jgi:hypothetical protein
MWGTRLQVVGLMCAGALVLSGCGDDEPMLDAAVDATVNMGFDASTSEPDGAVDAALTVFDAGADDANPDAGPCPAGSYPDISGDYDNLATGDCGDFGNSFDQVIAPTIAGFACEYTLTSIGIKSDPDVNGDIQIDTGGNFSGDTLQLGTMSYTCDGAWNDPSGEMTLTCTGVPGVCTVVMSRNP